MRREVPIMRLDSILSPGLLKSGLRRFWPLWLVGLIGLVLLVDVPLYGAAGEIARDGQSLAERQEMMNGAWVLMRLFAWGYALVGSITVALVLHEHLFDARSATFVGSLPVRRRQVFASIALAGLVVLLVLPLLVVAMLLPLHAMLGALMPLDVMARWYAFAALFVAVLYATALVSCHLAGTRVVALLLYLVINFLAVCLEAAVQMVVSGLVYGMGSTRELFDWASPAAWLLGTAFRLDEPVASAGGIGIACYVLAAAVMIALAGWLFSRRDLEAAGDSVAVARLRPVLGVLAGISTSLLFSSIYHLTHLFDWASGTSMTAGEAAAMTALMVLGTLVGVLLAEMLMRRSTHVLAYCWRTGLVLAAAAVAFVGACWFDVAGVGHYVPDADEVAEVALCGNWANEFTLTSPEAIAATCDLQRDVISYGAMRERGESTFSLTLAYRLKGGRVVSRSYPIVSQWYYSDGEDGASDAGTDLVKRYVALADSPEGRAARFSKVLGSDPAGLSFLLDYLSADGTYQTSIELPLGERASLVEALRHDLLEEPAGEVLDQHDWADGYDATLSIQCPSEDGLGVESLLSMQLCEDRCPHTVAWFKEHHPEVVLQAWPVEG